MNLIYLKLLGLVGSALAGMIPGVGQVVDLGVQLGAFNWVGKLLVKILADRFGLGTDVSVKLVKSVGVAITTTDSEIKKGTLVTPEDKQKFAANLLKESLKNDPDFKDVQNFDSAAVLLIELIYQLQQLSQQTKNKK